MEEEKPSGVPSTIIFVLLVLMVIPAITLIVLRNTEIARLLFVVTPTVP